MKEEKTSPRFKSDKNENETKPDSPKQKAPKHRLNLAPKSKAVLHMSLCMAVHFAGHELARGPTNSMFTSKDIGFQSAAALPLGLGLVSPFTIFVLKAFSKTLNKHGPRFALVKSTIFGASFLIGVGLSLKYLASEEVRYVVGVDSQLISKGLLFSLFVFQSANVQFLYTQHWSFLGSILTAEEGKSWFAPIAGIGSITSTLAASQVSTFVEKIGLIALLCTAGLIIGSSAIFADAAYSVARENGFEPKNDEHKKGEKKNIEKALKDANFITSTRRLFRRVPILRAMFFEVMLSQFVSSILNFHFMLKVKDAITDDEERAGWTGSCYAWINGISGMMQFFILPAITKAINPKWLWLSMPGTMLSLTATQLFLYGRNPPLSLVACSFLSMKIIEYSLRGQVSEMVFASLDYESRFVGKQKIGLMANRLGKSITAVSLFFLATHFEKDESELYHILVLGSNFAAFLWLFTTLNLTNFMDNPSISAKSRGTHCEK